MSTPDGRILPVAWCLWLGAGATIEALAIVFDDRYTASSCLRRACIPTGPGWQARARRAAYVAASVWFTMHITGGPGFFS